MIATFQHTLPPVHGILVNVYVTHESGVISEIEAGTSSGELRNTVLATLPDWLRERIAKTVKMRASWGKLPT